MLDGKGAMVWQLRNWMGGDPVAQAEHASALGLDWVSIKLLDGDQEKWADYNKSGMHNFDLAPMTIAALRGEGIEVAAWGWTYGGYYLWKTKDGKVNRIFIPSKAIARREGQAAVRVMHKHGLLGWQIDAEHEYRKGFLSDRRERANAYCAGLQDNPLLINSLCSYRFPRTAQPDFPIDSFMPFMENWSPQVYFEGDNRTNGGAIQLQICVNQYRSIRPLPMTPIGPAYKGKNGWRPTKPQLRLFFEKAEELGCNGVGLWAIDRATPAELEALREFDW